VTPIVNNYVYEGVAYLDLENENGASGFIPANTGLPTVGTATAASPPPNIANLIKKTIAGTGRNKRPGRWYLPPSGEIEYDEDGLLSSALTTQLQATMSALLADWNSVVVPGGDTAIMVQPHWAGEDDPGDAGGIWPAVATSVVTGLVPDPKCGTQRRRLR
jgi:hypothetical protein